MLRKMDVNETICSTFEVQYGKIDVDENHCNSAIRHLGHLKQFTWFRACAESHTFFNTGRALFLQITLIIFIVEPPKLYSETGVGDSKNVIVLTPYSWVGLPDVRQKEDMFFLFEVLSSVRQALALKCQAFLSHWLAHIVGCNGTISSLLCIQI